MQHAQLLSRLTSPITNLKLLRVKHTYQQEVILLACLGLSAFYYTALLSFSPIDPSWVSGVFPPAQPTNMAGSIGAHIAGFVFFSCGVAAFLLPLPLLFSSILLVRKSPVALSRSRLLGWCLAILSVAIIASAKYPIVVLEGFRLPSGGVIGGDLSTLLLTYLGDIGSAIIVLTTSLCSLMLIVRKSFFASAWKKSPDLFHMVKERLKPKRKEKPDALFAKTLKPVMKKSKKTEETAPLEALFADPIYKAAPDKPKAVIKEASAPKEIEPVFDDDYTPPPKSIFQTLDPSEENIGLCKQELEQTAKILVKTFTDFNVQGKIIGFQPGPVVTVFEFQLDAGIKQAKVLGLIDDIALALKVDSIFINPVVGKRALGIQVPNKKRETVYLGDILNSDVYANSPSPLTFAMGKMLNGKPVCADLTTMPHLLVAGATGTGKSVAVNALLSSIIMKASPDEVRMILVDPKMLELSVYEGIPHLLMPVITEPSRAAMALSWATREMERRYKLMQLASVRHISGFNLFWSKATNAQKQEIREASGEESITKLPYILLVIDELADLMMTAPKEVESSIQRLAQKARASGIHMVLATQRPSVDIITGVIKANLPCRIAFQVVSKHDSRTILDRHGAEKLLNKGDMLIQRPGVGRLERIQGALISDEEVLSLAATAKKNSKARYDDEIISWIEDEVSRQGETGAKGETLSDVDEDPKFEPAMDLARTTGAVSASFLQRHLKIGYNRAARIVEYMEAREFVGKADGAKPRKWLGPTT